MAHTSPNYAVAGALDKSYSEDILLAALAAVHFRFTLVETSRFRLQNQTVVFRVELETRLGEISCVSDGASVADSGLQILRAEHAGHAKLHYDSEIYDSATAESILTSLRDALDHWDGECTVEGLHFPSARSRLDEIGAISFPTVPYPKQTCLGDLFHSIARQYANQVALVADDTGRQITYAELDAQSDVVAQWAISLHPSLNAVDGERAIAVWTENSIQYPIVVFGILKAGLAILPLDPRTPRSRIEAILGDRRLKQTCIPIISPGNTNTAGFRDMGYPLHELSSVLLGSWPTAQLTARANGSTLAFYCYTSGSTGKPKGLMINHHTIARVSKSAFFSAPSASDVAPSTPVTRPAPSQIWTNLSNNAWSFAHVEMFTPLLNGATSLPIPHERVVDLPLLSATFIKRAVNVAFMVPALVAALCREHAEARPCVVQGTPHQLVWLLGDSFHVWIRCAGLRPRQLRGLARRLPSTQICTRRPALAEYGNVYTGFSPQTGPTWRDRNALHRVGGPGTWIYGGLPKRGFLPSLRGHDCLGFIVVVRGPKEVLPQQRPSALAVRDRTTGVHRTQ